MQLISSRSQLLVEGKDAAIFFEAMKAHLCLEDLQIQNFGGVTELSRFLRALVRHSDFHQVTSIGVVRDAEKSADDALKSVQGDLRSVHLPAPETVCTPEGDSPVVSVLILPGANRDGMLETLLCETIPDDVGHCIDRFLGCVENISGKAVSRPHKSRAMAYLSTQARPQVSVGVAAKKSYWDLDHAALQPVQRFLRSITTST